MKITHLAYTSEEESFCKISQSAEDGSCMQKSRHKKQQADTQLHRATELPTQAKQDTI
jgi:hypothetical protein